MIDTNFIFECKTNHIHGKICRIKNTTYVILKDVKERPSNGNECFTERFELLEHVLRGV